MSDVDDIRPVRCASYTYARRHPKVLGKIGGWAPPVQPTFPQIGVFTVALLVLWKTVGLWSILVPVPFVQMLVMLGGPMGAAWAVRRSRVEGRSLPRAALGVLRYVTRPPAGRVGGRPQRTTSPVTDWRAHRIWIGVTK